MVPSGPLLVERADAFGLTHRTLDTGQASELYVRPRAISLPEIAASLARSVDGPQSDTTMEGTLAFHALREYVPGDELRHVHWRASAHAGKSLVKQHVDTAHAALAVVLDLVAAPGEPGAEAFEVAVDCAASVAASAASRRYPVILVDTSTGESLLPGARCAAVGGCTVDDVLDALTKVTTVPGPADPLPDVLRRLAAGPRGSLAVVISVRPMDWLADALRRLAGGYARVLAVHVIDGDEQAGSVDQDGPRPVDGRPAGRRTSAAASPRPGRGVTATMSPGPAAPTACRAPAAPTAAGADGAREATAAPVVTAVLLSAAAAGAGTAHVRPAGLPADGPYGPGRGPGDRR